jgi:molecular chaperone HtpG
MEDGEELAITIDVDKEARTVTISDNGIGMSHDEVIQNLGTIASSGTKKFVESLSGDEAKDAKMIGQFVVGFYSVFMVADKVTVESRRAGEPADAAIKWSSNGEGEYQLESTTREQRGTSITLHLREDEDEFLEKYRLRSIIEKYSDHITLPIRMKGMSWNRSTRALHCGHAVKVIFRKKITTISTPRYPMTRSRRCPFCITVLRVNWNTLHCYIFHPRHRMTSGTASTAKA